MCHFGGIYIGFMLEICLVEDESSFSSSMSIFHIKIQGFMLFAHR